MFNSLICCAIFRNALLSCLLLISLPALPYINDAAIQLNVQNGELRDLIKWVAQSSGKKVIIDPRVQGNVTVLANNTMTADEAWQTLLSVLQVHGYAAVDTNGIIKILPDNIARLNTVPVVDGKENKGDELVIRIIKPQHIKLVGVLEFSQRPVFLGNGWHKPRGHL